MNKRYEIISKIYYCFKCNEVFEADNEVFMVFKLQSLCRTNNAKLRCKKSNQWQKSELRYLNDF